MYRFLRHKIFAVVAAVCGMQLLWLCHGCRVGPKYHPPEPEVPSEWKTSVSDEEVAYYRENWWEVFDDEKLDELEQEAIENNPNLYVALERVAEARALACVKKADLYPHIDLKPNFFDAGILFKLFAPTGIPNPTSLPDVFRIHAMLYNLVLSTSYEVDLWGKIRGQYESAVYSAEAQLEDYYTSLLTLTTDLAGHYFQLRTFDAQLDFLKLTINTYQRDVDIIRSRFDKGITNYVDVSNASLQVTNAQANYENTRRLRRIEENAIAVLIGRAASEFCLEPNPLVGSPPAIPAGIPATVLLQRPDIAEAERKMASEHVMIGVAYASFLPSLNLTSYLGYLSPDFRQFMRWISRLWVFGASANEPIFEGGKNVANLRIAWAKYREASGAYQQQVLVAFQEVEDALNNIETQATQAGFLQDSVKWSEQTYSLSKNRYQKGLVNYLEVVDSERAALNAELSLISIQGARYLSTIQLIKAIGGSWCSEVNTDGVCD